MRARRLLALTLRDLRRLAIAPIPRTSGEWESRVYGRLSVLPEEATPLQRGQLLAALSIGREIFRLRRITGRFELGAELDGALQALMQGNTATVLRRLDRLDQLLVSPAASGPEVDAVLRARGSILAISEALTQHAAYFDAGAPA